MIADTHTAILAWQQMENQTAAAWLVRTHRPLVVRSIRRSGMPAEMEDDVMQEVFVRVFRALPGYKPEHPFAHWLAVITRNTCAKLRRRWHHRRALSACFENAALDVGDCVLPDSRRPDHTLMAKELEAGVLTLLDALPPRERSLIESQWHDEPPSSQNGAERIALHRARARLRKQARLLTRGSPQPLRRIRPKSEISASNARPVSDQSPIPAFCNL